MVSAHSGAAEQTQQAQINYHMQHNNKQGRKNEKDSGGI